jgi:hypothetical protein
MALPSPSQLPYTNLTDLKAYLNIASTDTSQDLFLSNLTKNVQGFIDRYTGRTFGWGDQSDSGGLFDSDTVDYSNSDNIGIVSVNLSGSLLTVNTQGPAPWTVGENVSLYAMKNPAQNGVWKVNTINNAAQIVVDLSASMGTLGLSYLQTITNNPGGSANGFIGNAVSNYKYKMQDQYDGLVGKTIYLRNMDIRSIDTLYIGLRNVAQPVLLDHTQYVWRNDGRIILGGAYFNSYDSGIYASGNDNAFYGTVAAGYQTITASYWYGYTGVPDDIEMAMLDLCAAMYTMRKALGVMQERIGDYEIRYDINLRKALKQQPDTLNILNLMRRRHISA